MTEYSRMAKGSFTATGTSAIIQLPFIPDFVEIWNYSNIKTKANSTIARAWWDANFIDTASNTNPTMVEAYNSGGTLVFDQISNSSTNMAINGYSAGIALQFGPTFTVSTVTGSARPTVVTTSAPHGYQVGDTIVMSGIAVGTTNNMQLLNNVWFTISAVGSTTTFSVQWDSSGANYTTVSPTGATVKKVLYPFLYPPQDSVVTVVTLGATTTVVTADYHNLEVGQEIAFRVPNIWGTTQLNSLPDILIPGSPIYGYVTSVTDNWTFVCNINSAAFTAYTNNFAMTAATLPGLTFPQVVAVGDVNTGGNASNLLNPNLYPSPQFPTSTNRVSTINGPAIRGAFVNNTSMGFTIGNGLPAVVSASTATLIANTNQVLWHAYKHDFSSP